MASDFGEPSSLVFGKFDFEKVETYQMDSNTLCFVASHQISNVSKTLNS